MDSFNRTFDCFSFGSDAMDLDNIEEYNGTHDFGTKYVQDLVYQKRIISTGKCSTFWNFDSFRSDTEMPFQAEPDSAEPFDADISMNFEVCPPSDKDIHDEDMIDADAEEEYMATETKINKFWSGTFSLLLSP